MVTKFFIDSFATYFTKIIIIERVGFLLQILLAKALEFLRSLDESLAPGVFR